MNIHNIKQRNIKKFWTPVSGLVINQLIKLMKSSKLSDKKYLLKAQYMQAAEKGWRGKTNEDKEEPSRG